MTKPHIRQPVLCYFYRAANFPTRKLWMATVGFRVRDGMWHYENRLIGSGYFAPDYWTPIPKVPKRVKKP